MKAMVYDEELIEEEEIMENQNQETYDIEKLIKENLHSLEVGMEVASDGEYFEGCPLFKIYYDRDNKGCLMLDEYRLSGCHCKIDDILPEFVWKHPERFVRVPHEIGSHDYDLMEEFAYKKKSAKLISALQGKRPMATFNDLVIELGLRSEWFAFRSNAYDRAFEEWKEENGIK